MAAKQRTAGKKKPPAATETSESIEEMTKHFLKAGGKIQQIEKGVSGQQGYGGQRQISLASNKTKSSS